MSDNPLDQIFDCLTECAAILEGHAEGGFDEIMALNEIHTRLRRLAVPVDVPIGWLKVAQDAVIACRELLDETERGALQPADDLRLVRIEVNSDVLMRVMYESGYIRHGVRRPAAGE